jgi:hypothetical protein
MRVLETYTQNDTAPDLVFDCIQDGSALNLTGALAVLLTLAKPSGAVVAVAMTIDVTPTTGRVSYTPVAGTFDEVGDYECDVKITYANSNSQHCVSPFLIRVRAEHEDF